MDQQFLISLLNAIQRLVEINEEMLLETRRSRSEPYPAAPIQDVLSDLIDSVDVKSILKISDSTLYRLKRSGALRTVAIGKREYFSLTEIKTLINRFKK